MCYSCRAGDSHACWHTVSYATPWQRQCSKLPCVHAVFVPSPAHDVCGASNDKLLCDLEQVLGDDGQEMHLARRAAQTGRHVRAASVSSLVEALADVPLQVHRRRHANSKFIRTAAVQTTTVLAGLNLVSHPCSLTDCDSHMPEHHLNSWLLQVDSKH